MGSQILDSCPNSKSYIGVIKIDSRLHGNKKNVKMGKGDSKTKRGKIANKTYGARRKRKIKKRTSIEEKISVEKSK